jgi:hypothetical protein
MREVASNLALVVRCDWNVGESIIKVKKKMGMEYVRTKERLE